MKIYIQNAKACDFANNTKEVNKFHLHRYSLSNQSSSFIALRICCNYPSLYFCLSSFGDNGFKKIYSKSITIPSQNNYIISNEYHN